MDGYTGPPPYRGFKYEYGCLSFNPVSKMLYIGHRDGEDLWLGMIPCPILEGHSEDTPGQCSGLPWMNTHHYRQLVMIFVAVLDKLRNQAFICYDIYGVDLEGGEPQFINYTDIL